MSDEVYESRGAIEVVLDECLTTLREKPLQTLNSAWFEGVFDWLLALKPENAYVWFYRLSQELERHSVMHGCRANEILIVLMERKLYGLQVR